MHDVLSHGYCLDVLHNIPGNSVDSIVTDPPYGIKFMGKTWDYDVPSQAIWQECLRVLKPGGHLLSFAGSRTQHRMAARIEDAGFEIRDMIVFLYETSNAVQALIESLSRNSSNYWTRHLDVMECWAGYMARVFRNLTKR